MPGYTLAKGILHWCAVVAATSVLLLICSGGLVTSHEAGMSVPDWPNSFGYNMFLFPISRWVGGVFFEHTHRLIASGVGLLTVILCIALYRIEDRRWVKTLGLIAVGAVILQGVLGGLRVTENNALLGLFHGCLAQGFFGLMATIALVTSRFWRNLERGGASGNERERAGTSGNEPACQYTSASSEPSPLTTHQSLLPSQRSPLAFHTLRSLRFWVLVVTAMVFLQLVLGASMRHSHAGLSITDFPLSYGRIFPPLDAASMAKINEIRGAAAQPYTSAGLILLQYVHRIWALFIVAGIGLTATRLLRDGSIPAFFHRLAGAWIGLVIAQSCLGAWTILSNKAADIATAHVAFGALTLVTGVLLCVGLTGLLISRATEISHPTAQRSIELGKV
jgi:heme a synthase